MKKEDVEALVFKNTEHKSKYGEKYTDHLLDQYKIYLSMLDKISERRQKSNEFFMGLNTAVIGLLGYIETRRLPHTALILLSIPIAGGIICVFWCSIIKSYKNLNTAKFAVVHAIEQRLPITMFETEWAIVGNGENKRKYHPFTHIEINIPLSFTALYVFMFFVNIPWPTIVLFFNKTFLK